MGDDVPKNTLSPTETTRNTAPVPPPCSGGKQKRKRFRFTETYDLYLLKAVRSADAHLPEWGKTESLYEEVTKTFLRAIHPSVLAQSQESSGKRFADRFKRLVSRRREDVKRTSPASGIIEKHGEKEQLLDDLIVEIDEKEDAVRAEKEEQAEQEIRLVAAGETSRDLELKRKTKGNGDSESDSREGKASSAASSAKKRRRREAVQSDDDITASMLEEAAERRKLEKRRLDLESERMEIERERSCREVKRFEQLQQGTNRRLDLDEKRFAVEVEERKQSIDERKKMVDVMALLCKKLE